MDLLAIVTVTGAILYLWVMVFMALTGDKATSPTRAARVRPTRRWPRSVSSSMESVKVRAGVLVAASALVTTSLLSSTSSASLRLQESA